MKRLFNILAALLATSQLLLVLLSWFLAATTGTDGSVRSLLSPEGMRFFFGSFVDMLLAPPLAWLLLAAMAWGCLRQSGLLHCFKQPSPQRHHRALLLLLTAVAAVYAGVVALLAAAPHAVLLSATGGLFPSPFSRALVPLLAFGVVLLASVYGFATRRFASPAQLWQSLAAGVAAASPLFPLYVLAAQLAASLHFVFGGTA